MTQGRTVPVLSRSEFQRRALELFKERSFGQVSMRELAAHLGISPGAIYHHVESKEAMLFEWLMELYQALLSHVDLIKTRRLTPAQRVTKLIEGHLQLHEHMTGHFKLAVMDSNCLGAPMQASVEQLRRAYESEFMKLVGQLGHQPGGPLRASALTAILPMLNSLPAWLSPMIDDSHRRIITKTIADAVLQAINSLP
ncbi:TetR/AcrR family transcriptional regulator [Pseudomonas sp. NKUCC02_KPG]|uniref:TetR/AcrR family transcriptional regulator n=1 Tax=Pseudomonas sp. NKUCC02_KPG TaxID=2842124 RepID=UPI001C5B1FE6|nr:TetR/AcrR family transcriptional regulator [Pseudomonas sp. NKUCC02_KPG]MBW3505608.1 TetR/AcrR family transcriptional regulator; helix-turn-helix transcriptional regulator [Pseudomonas sp. NKUCC02_KPG]